MISRFVWSLAVSGLVLSNASFAGQVIEKVTLLMNQYCGGPSNIVSVDIPEGTIALNLDVAGSATTSISNFHPPGGEPVSGDYENRDANMKVQVSAVRQDGQPLFAPADVASSQESTTLAVIDQIPFAITKTTAVRGSKTFSIPPMNGPSSANFSAKCVGVSFVDSGNLMGWLIHLNSAIRGRLFLTLKFIFPN